MRRDNELKQRLSAGGAALGTWAVLPAPGVTNVIAAAGFDFVIVDLEHGPFSLSETEDLIRTAESEGRSALVRVPRLDESWILRALETGAHGVVVPQITSADEARAAVAAVKYHPEGRRGLSPYTRSGGYSAEDAARLAARENRRSMVVLLVEGTEGIANLPEILTVPGIDVIYLGIYDLSQSVGRPGEIDHPQVRAEIERCVTMIAARGLTAGCLASDRAALQHYRQLGVRFLAYQADCALLHDACREVVAAFQASPTPTAAPAPGKVTT